VLLSEDTPQTATTRKGRIRCELEAEMQARSAQGLRSVVIRAGDFFGSGTGSWLDLAIAKSLRAGKLVYPGPLDRPHAWAYLPDLARAFVAAAGLRDGAAFTALHFAGHTLTGAELLAAIERNARVLGLAPAGPLQRGGLPWRMIRLGGLVVPIWRELAEMQYLWDRPHALDGRRMQALLGPLPATPLNEALQQSLRTLFGGAAAQQVWCAPAAERPEIAR
jgi:nucleoside-diphosphate-sugar epimerase